MVKWFIAAILLFPAAEIAVFIAIAAIIGLLWALGLMFATTLAGFLVLRRAGRRRIANFRIADTVITGIEANTGGFLTVLAGLLLFLPGFLTDLIGAALLIGPIRRRCGAAFRQWVSGRDRTDRSVVDLAPEEWERVPDRELRNNAGKTTHD